MKSVRMIPISNSKRSSFLRNVRNGGLIGDEFSFVDQVASSEVGITNRVKGYDSDPQVPAEIRHRTHGK